jgi:hypothetical protein
MTPLLNERYHIIIDNWFSSPDLHEKLCSKQGDVMETLHQTRNSVPAELKEKLKKREHNDNEIDKCDDSLVSAIHNDTMVAIRV